MSYINSAVKPFNATAYHNDKFIPVSDADRLCCTNRLLASV